MTGKDAGAEALMAAITGEPLPKELRDDPETLAEHRLAVADVAVLREQLRIVGGALAEHAPVAADRPPRPADHAPSGRPGPGRRSLWSRRGLHLSLGAVAVACAVALFAGLASLAPSGDAGSADSAAKGTAGDNKEVTHDGPGTGGMGGLEYLACTRLIVEGTVRSVEPLSDGTDRVRVTVDTLRYYRPSSGAARQVLLIDRELGARPGQRVLIGVTRHADGPDMWSTGPELARDRAWIIRTLPSAGKTQCVSG